MVVAINMEKTSLKVSVSNSESSSSEEEFDGSHNEAEDSAEGDVNTDDNVTDDEVIMKNEGWADSISKILGANKPKNKKTLVLSRAKKLADVIIKEKEEKPSFEVIGEKIEETTDVKRDDTTKLEPPPKKKKLEKSTIRVKPNILEKDRERLLSKIATKGVVQLFNAVRNQQKTFDRDLSKDLPDGKKEKIMKKFDKRAFLDTLMGQSKSLNVEQHTKSLKDEIKGENEKPRWNALRDDFMMGAKMKDWDKESIEE